MTTQIFIENNQLDISNDIPSLLTFAIDDVKDFSTRSTTFSKTIVLPGTANNNKLFGSIFETGVTNDYDPTLDNIRYNFNASKSAKCIMFQDNLQTFKGTIRMLEIVNDKRRIEYEVALNGELTSLSVALSTGFLEDLDFSIYNTSYTAPIIAASWDNVPGSGVYWPLIDYGNYSVDKHNWNFKTFRPALYVKEYIDKMFVAAQFRYTCDLFNTDRFKRLIVPHNQKVLTSKTSTANYGFKYSSQSVIPGPTVGLWDGFVGGGFSYAGGLFTYTAGTTITTTVSWRLGGYRFSSTPGTFRISIRKNGVTVASTVIPTFNITVVYSYQDSIPLTFSTGDTIDVFWEELTGTGMAVTFFDNGPATLIVSSNTPVVLPVNYNEAITINDSIPKNIRQVDFLVSIVKLFNLYVYESQFDERLILIKPFVDFYSVDGSNAVDWTYKMDREQPIRIKPLSELNSKIYNFNYKDDSDFYNDLYKKRYNQGYGSNTYDSQFEFASQTNKLELIFAGTPLVGYDTEDKVYSTIFKRTGNTPPYTEENIDSVIRILQTKKVTSVSSWSIKNGGSDAGTYTFYGYAGHFDDPDAPSNDLNFGVLNELFFVLVSGDLTRTQFNVYWSTYMAEITDKDSKMLIARFYLTPKDIFNLDFSTYVVVDNILYRLNKITDYNTTNPDTCVVELLRAINTFYSFPPVEPPIPGETNFLLWNTGQVMLYSGTADKILNS